MSTVAARRRGTSVAEPKLRTIGAICDELREEFPDISRLKIRYLEDQGLIAPRRPRGGYRLFSPEDVERLVTILRLQRDEFLPLRVIRQELDGPGAGDRTRPPQHRPLGARGGDRRLRALRARFRVARVPAPARGVRGGRLAGRGWRPASTRESEADIAAASARLARFGIDARHLDDPDSRRAPGGARRGMAGGAHRCRPASRAARCDVRLFLLGVNFSAGLRARTTAELLELPYETERTHTRRAHLPNADAAVASVVERCKIKPHRSPAAEESSSAAYASRSSREHADVVGTNLLELAATRPARRDPCPRE